MIRARLPFPLAVAFAVAACSHGSLGDGFPSPVPSPNRTDAGSVVPRYDGGARSDASASPDASRPGPGVLDASPEDAGFDAGPSCGDTTSDPSNCGACGHGCLGGTCASGLCAPVVFGNGDNIADFALDATSVYYVDIGGTDTLTRANKDGTGTPSALAAAPSTETWSSGAMAVAGGAVVWSYEDFTNGSTGVRSVLAAGGASAILAVNSASTPVTPHHLAALGSTAYYSFGCEDLYSVPLTGGPAATLANNGCNTFDTFGPVVDPGGTAAYLDDPFAQSLWSVALADGAEAVLESSFDGAGPFALSGGALDWAAQGPECGQGATCTSGRIEEATVAGGAPEVLVSSLLGGGPGGAYSYVGDVFADATSIFYVTVYEPSQYEYTNALVEVSRATGAQLVLWVGSGQPTVRVLADGERAYTNGSGVIGVPR
jgi:hypothetical protein